mgnify:CR=1 FL=1
MDRQIEKKSFLRRYAWYIAAAAALAALLVWIVLGTTASTTTVDVSDITISDVTRGKFDDYVRLNGQVLSIQVVQISPEEGGIVREKVVEEGTRVRKGDVILRLSNSNLDLQILNAEAELAEKQNLLRNTQVAMQQDRLNNRTEQLRSTPTATASAAPTNRTHASTRNASSVRRCICRVARTITSPYASRVLSRSA